MLVCVFGLLEENQVGFSFLVYQTHSSNALKIGTQYDWMDQVRADQESGREALWAQSETEHHFTSQGQGLTISHL